MNLPTKRSPAAKQLSAVCCLVMASVWWHGCSYLQLDPDLKTQGSPITCGRATQTAALMIDVLPNEVFDVVVDEGKGATIRAEIMRAFNESRCFQQVDFVDPLESPPQGTGLIARVRLTSEKYITYRNLLTLITVGFFPVYSTDTVVMTITIEDGDSTEKGKATKQVVLTQWIGWLVPSRHDVDPGAKLDSAIKGGVFHGLTREALRDLRSKGTL